MSEKATLKIQIFSETEKSPLVHMGADKRNGGHPFPLQSLTWRVSHYRVTASFLFNG